MRILIVWSDLNCSCTRKCTFELSKALNLTDYCETCYYAHLNEYHYRNFDYIIFQRLGANSKVIPDNYLRYIEYAATVYPGKTIYMIDDLLFTPVVKRFMKAADYLLLPHESYNEHVEEFEKPILYLGTFIDDDVFNRVGAKELRRDKVNILLASTGFEGNLFFDTLKENLESKVGDRIALHIFGKGKILSVYELMEYFKSADICLNIAIPNKQYDSDFLNCKSEIKYAYCVHSETVIISHPTDPYMRAIEHGINGYLIKSDINLWVDTIASLVGSKELRKDITKEAKKDKKKYSLYGVNKRLIQQLKELGE